MSRRKGVIHKKQPIPDPVFSDQRVARFVSNMMKQGKKELSYRIFYQAMDIIQEKEGKEGIVIFRQAMSKVEPQVEVRSRRVGGATYQIPVDVRPERAEACAIRWLIISARARKEKSMNLRLAAELIDASKGQGGAVKKRDETRRMADANKAFSHYRW